MLCETLCDFLSPKELVLRGVGALVVSSIIGFLFSRLFWVVLVMRVVQVAGAQLTGCVAVCFSFMRLWQLILMTIGPRRRLRRLRG